MFNFRTAVLKYVSYGFPHWNIDSYITVDTSLLISCLVIRLS